MSETEKYFQGTWRAAGEIDLHTWFLEWTFNSGRFKQLGYPAIFQEGKYMVVGLADNKWPLIKLLLSFMTKKELSVRTIEKLEIVMGQEIEQLSISNMKGFSRVAPIKTN